MPENEPRPQVGAGDTPQNIVKFVRVGSVLGLCCPNHLISHACVDVCDFLQMRGQQ
jgi:hypothetical protein